MRHTLSAIVPNYNHAHYLEGALLSILTQSWPPDELIVIDDCSTDNSMDILTRLAQQHPTLRVIQNDTNLGAWGNCQKLCKLPKCDYTVSLAADDVMLPGYLEKSMTLLTQHPSAAMCFSYPASIDVDTGQICPNPTNFSQTPRYFSPEEIATSLRGNYIPGHTTVMKTEAFQSSGGYHEGNQWHSDWFLLLVLAFRYGACFIPEALAAVRPSPNTYSSANRKDFSKQRAVLAHIITLVKSPEYRDVLPFFIKSRALCHFGEEIVRTVAEIPELQDAQTLLLIQQPLWEWSERFNPKPQDQGIGLNNGVIVINNCIHHARELRASDKFKEAAQYLARAVNQFPTSTELYKELSQLFVQAGDLNAAKDALQAGLSILASDPELLAERGWLEIAGNNLTAAASYFTQVSSVLPHHPRGAQGMAVVAERSGQKQDALRWLINACTGAPMDPDLHITAARLAFELGHLPEARLLAERAVRINPLSREAQQQLELVLTKSPL